MPPIGPSGAHLVISLFMFFLDATSAIPRSLLDHKHLYVRETEAEAEIRIYVSIIP